MSDTRILINTTPHSITLVQPDGTDHEYASVKASVLRLAEQPTVSWDMAYGVPTHPPPQWAGLEWSQELPKIPSGIKGDLLVSMVVGEYLRTNGMPADWTANGIERVYGPDTSGQKAVRNHSGQVIGSHQLIRYV